MLAGLVDAEATTDETLDVALVDATEGGRESEGATDVDLDIGADAGIGTAVGEGMGTSIAMGCGAGGGGAGADTTEGAGAGIDAERGAGIETSWALEGAGGFALVLRSRSGLVVVLATRTGGAMVETVALTLLAVGPTFTRLGPSTFLGSRLGFWVGGGTATRCGIIDGSIGGRAGRNRRVGPAAGGCGSVEPRESELGRPAAWVAAGWRSTRMREGPLELTDRITGAAATVEGRAARMGPAIAASVRSRRL